MSEDENQNGVLVLTHLQAEGSCNFGRILKDRGYRIRTLNTPAADLNLIDPLRPDILIVMGGPVGVYQQELYPFLTEEIEIIKARLKADLPTIGVCLGSQLMAAALGSRVYKGEQGQELGWYPLQIAKGQEQSEARHLTGDQTQMFHWHGDTFDLPPECTLLASSALYKNQIFTYGKNALALQCHPEVTESQLQEWMVMFVGQLTGPNAVMPIEKLRETTHTHIATLERQTSLFFNEWLDNRGL